MSLTERDLEVTDYPELTHDNSLQPQKDEVAETFTGSVYDSEEETPQEKLIDKLVCADMMRATLPVWRNW